jgi:hypothetical protein
VGVSGRELFEEYFRAIGIRYAFNNRLLLHLELLRITSDPTEKAEIRATLGEVLTDIENEVSALRADTSELSTMLASSIEVRSKRNIETIRRKIGHHLGDKIGELREQLAAIPNSEEKARTALISLANLWQQVYEDQTYDAMVLCKSEVKDQWLRHERHLWLHLEAAKHRWSQRSGLQVAT